MVEKTDERICFNDVISEFNNQLYDNIFTSDNVISKQKCINIGGDKVYGYFLEKGKKTYFCLPGHIEILPFKIVKSKETDYKGDVFEVILQVESIVIPAEKRMSFKTLVDNLPKFKHTNDAHWTLYKILAIASWVDRLNARVCTDAGFGKDSVVNIISGLVDSTANVYGATFAKLEFHLKNNLVILNELGNLKQEEKFIMQEFLLAVGAFFNKYQKRTRKSGGTLEEYDIGKLSMLIFYNLPKYYSSKNQEFFDQMFQPAVGNRLIPFVFDGRITTDFSIPISPKDVIKEHGRFLTELIATLYYYKENNVSVIKWKVPESIIFDDTSMRHERSFNVILKYLGEYCDSQKDFDFFALELYNCYKKYGELVNKESFIFKGVTK